ncbi:MAG: DUF3656 domain-containing protein [Clostridia bacterium]|nr:DUF3656 domain-containing protein [Clostridia bacterium]
MDRKSELLAPAGSIESFKAAIENGADAVYMGVNKYNAREMATNFTIEEYIEAIHYAHIRGVKVYLTLNTLIYDDEIHDAISLIVELYSHGLDAVIVQDIGLAMNIRKIVPNIRIHASTQMSVHSLKQVKFLEKYGFSRVVLARELSVNEIEYICKNTSVEIEVFVHGALCVSYSGQCLMSSMIGLRSGNRGKCAQPCRMKYSLYETMRENRYKSEKCLKENMYLLSKKDIFGLEHIPKLLDAGVKSLKIEGRSKTAEYVAGVTRIYKKYLEMAKVEDVRNEDKEQLMQIFNRDGISSGYLDDVKYADSITLTSPKNTGIFLGTVLDQRKEYVKLRLESNIDLHDGIEVYNEDNTASTIVTIIKDSNFKTVNSEVSIGNVVWIGDISRRVEVGSRVYKTSSSMLNEELKKAYAKIGRRQKIKVVVNILKDKNMSIELITKEEKSIKYELDHIPEMAKNKEIDEKYVNESLSKINDYPFEFEDIKINLDTGLFVPLSKLNELRRNSFERLIESYKINIDVDNITNKIQDLLKLTYTENKINNRKVKETIYLYKFNKNKDYFLNEKAKNTSRIYINISDFKNIEDNIFRDISSKAEVFVCIPNIVQNNLDKYIEEKLENIIRSGTKGILIGNMGYIEKALELKQKYNIQLVIDYSLNVFNSYSASFYKSLGIDIITPSVELTVSEMSQISKICKIEIVQNYITVMTSRYCILGSFVSDRKENEKCKFPCRGLNYVLKDTHGLKYNVICDSTDCIMSLVRPIGDLEDMEKISNLESVRYCYIS